MSVDICPNCGLQLAALDTFAVGELTVVDAGNAIFWQDERVSLSPSERLIVTALARDAGHVIRRSALAELIGYEGDSLNIIAVFLNRIFRGFRRVDEAFNQIETVWGSGLRWRAA